VKGIERQLEEAILSIEEVAESTPWSKSTLYRIAPQPDSPFHKLGGRWVTTQAALVAWVESGPKPRRAKAESPMPRPRARRQSSFGAKVVQFERAS